MTPQPEISGYRKAKHGDKKRCGNCTYFNAGHCAMWNENCDKDAVCNEYEPAVRGEGAVLSDHASHASELFLAEGTVEARDGKIWATVLPVGEWAMTPDPRTGKPVNKPLRVIEGRSDDARKQIGLQDLIDAFREGAIQHVTIPLSHEDRPDENTGYIRDMRIEFDPKIGKTALRAAFDFTEPEIAGKVQRGSIAGRSAGILFDYADKKLGKHFKSVVGHIALTNKPWIGGMPSFAGDFNASDTGSYMLAATIDTRTATERVTDQLDDWSHGDLELVSLADGIATVRDKDGDTWEATITDGVITDPADWDQLMPTAKTTKVAPKGGDQMGKYDNLSPEELLAKLEEADSKLDAANAKDREAAIDARITELSEQGFAEQPGLLRVARDLMLADDGEVASVLLSEKGKTTQLTVTEIVEQMLGAFKQPDLGLSEQHAAKQEGKRADDTNEEAELTPRQRADLMRQALNIQTDLIAAP